MSLAEATATFAVLEEEAGRPSASTTFKQMYEDAMSKISELVEDMELARKILDDPNAPMSDQDREEREVLLIHLTDVHLLRDKTWMRLTVCFRYTTRTLTGESKA